MAKRRFKHKRRNTQEAYLERLQETFGIILIATATDPSEVMRQVVADSLRTVADYIELVIEFWKGEDYAEGALNELLEEWEEVIGEHIPYGGDIEKFVFAVAGLFHLPEDLRKYTAGE